MPRSRRRKREKVNALPAGVMRMSPEVHDALLRQREAFRAKFGRDPGPNDRKRCTAPTFRASAGCGLMPGHGRSI
jgi:hypothetical protein